MTRIPKFLISDENIYERLDEENIRRLETSEIAELLNKFYEENQQLKKFLNDDLDIALGFIKSKGYSLQDLTEYEQQLKEQ